MSPLTVLLCTLVLSSQTKGATPLLTQLQSEPQAEAAIRSHVPHHTHTSSKAQRQTPPAVVPALAWTPRSVAHALDSRTPTLFLSSPAHDLAALRRWDAAYLARAVPQVHARVKRREEGGTFMFVDETEGLLKDDAGGASAASREISTAHLFGPAGRRTDQKGGDETRARHRTENLGEDAWIYVVEEVETLNNGRLLRDVKGWQRLVVDAPERGERDLAPRLRAMLLRDGDNGEQQQGSHTANNGVVNTWWGGQVGLSTALHYDVSHNHFVQVRGCKGFTLFPPHTPNLRLYPELHPRARKSRVVVSPSLLEYMASRPGCGCAAAGDGSPPADAGSRRNHERKPETAQADDEPWTANPKHEEEVQALESQFPGFPSSVCAHAVCVRVCAGGHLFIPAHWFHHVSVLATPSVSLNVFSESLEERIRDAVFSLPLPFNFDTPLPSREHADGAGHDGGKTPQSEGMSVPRAVKLGERESKFRSRTVHVFLRMLLSQLGLTEHGSQQEFALSLRRRLLWSNPETSETTTGDDGWCANGTHTDPLFVPRVNDIASLLQTLPPRMKDRRMEGITAERGEEPQGHSQCRDNLTPSSSSSSSPPLSRASLGGAQKLILEGFVELLVNGMVHADPTRPNVKHTAQFLERCFLPH